MAMLVETEMRRFGREGDPKPTELRPGQTVVLAAETRFMATLHVSPDDSSRAVLVETYPNKDNPNARSRVLSERALVRLPHKKVIFEPDR